MKFKKDALPIDPKERLKYLYRFQEMLRLFHNEKGKDFHTGKMTEKAFRDFQHEWVRNRKLLICAEINKCKELIPEIVAEKTLALEERGKTLAIYKLAKDDEKILINITDIEEN